MSLFRNRRLSDDRLQMILRSLPQAKAPADLEEKLNHTIAEHSDHIPHVLGTLPLISAPDDFDARLMDAIRTQQPPSAPIPHGYLSDPAAINWVNHIVGWVGGAAIAVGMAFFIHSVEDSSHAGVAPVAEATRSAAPGISPVVPSWRTPSAPSGTSGRMIAGEMAPRIQEPAGESRQPVEYAQPQQPAVREGAASLTIRRDTEQPIFVQPAPVQGPAIVPSAETLRVKSAPAQTPQHGLNAVSHGQEATHGTIAPPHESTEATLTSTKTEDTSGAAAAASDSNGTSVSAGMGQVDTGREQIGQDQDTTRSNP